jgi:hypothetical protein
LRIREHMVVRCRIEHHTFSSPRMRATRLTGTLSGRVGQGGFPAMRQSDNWVSMEYQT